MTSHDGRPASYGAGRTPSTRYRDLVDLVLIVTTTEFDASLTAKALWSEARRRNVTLPARIGIPGPQWRTGYAAIARDSTLDASLHNVNAALATLGDCLNPLLANDLAAGRWDPQQCQWT